MVTRYTVQAGRGILCEGTHLVSIQHAEGTPPMVADELAHIICRLLNEEGRVAELETLLAVVSRHCSAFMALLTPEQIQGAIAKDNHDSVD